MLIGSLIKNFKIYSNITYTPITQGVNGAFSIFTGGNGVGKSSILEALNHFFNSTRWVHSTHSSKDEAFVTPIFLIKKTEFSFNDNPVLLEKLSNFFWDFEFTATNSTLKGIEAIKEFVTKKNKIKEQFNPDEYYLILIGFKILQPTSAYFSSFETSINNLLAAGAINQSDCNLLLNKIKDLYSYIYIPVESSTKELLKIESIEFQELMDVDVLNNIDRILNSQKRVEKKVTSLRKQKVNYSPLELINESLDEFIESINSSLQKIGKDYSFAPERGAKRNLSAQDVRDRIVEQYFSIRPLKKNGKLIENLSSGEQRIALFDVAYALLSQGKKAAKKIVLAIDEPEASMHMTQSYKQFIRLSELSKEFGHQVLITTHWYGFLPIIKTGYLNHIDPSKQEKKIVQLPLDTITSSTSKLPGEIALKSMFDLVSSVIGMMRTEKTNWLVCEGADDQVYYTYFLKGKIDSLCVLPLGGIDKVVKLYDYLYTPLSERGEISVLSGMVVCLTDTDPRPVHPEDHKTIINLLTLQRHQIHNNKVIFCDLNKNSDRHYTSIEDLLDSDTFFDAVKFVVNNSTNETIKDLMPHLKLNTEAQFSGFTDKCSCIEGEDMNYHKKIPLLIEFLKDHNIKYKLALAYVNLHKEKGLSMPDWTESIIAMFKPKQHNNKNRPHEEGTSGDELLEIAL